MVLFAWSVRFRKLSYNRDRSDMCSPLQTLAHDLSQPLSVIETTAYCLKLLLPEDDATIADHLQRIQQQVELAGRILSAAQAENFESSRARTNAEMAGVTY